MKFDFAALTEIVFGSGRIAELGARAKSYGRHALLVTGASSDRFPSALRALEQASVAYTVFNVPQEPTTELVRDGVNRARAAGVDLVIGLGGGSALDAAKAIAGLVANGGDPFDYLEVVGRGLPLESPGLPCLAIPTTSGTGSEVTKNSVLQAESHNVKVSLRSVHLLPKIALLDPELTCTVPPDVTAATGLDALTQCLEPFVSIARGPLTDALCVEGLRRGARSLRRAYEVGTDLAAREDLAVTSLFGGLSLANAKLGAVHGFAGPLGGALSAPHGALCARLLPEVMRVNIALGRQRAEHDVLSRYDVIAQLLTGRDSARAEDGVLWVRDCVAALNIPRLARYGLDLAGCVEIIPRARAASSMKGNPFELPEQALRDVLESAL